MRFISSAFVLPLLLAFSAHADEAADAAIACPDHDKTFSHAEKSGAPPDREALQAMMQERMSELGLSGTQQQDLQALVAIYGERLQAIAKRGETERRELLLASPLDADYGTLTNAVSQEAAAAAAETVNTLSELQRTAFDLLTNEQQDRLLALRAEQFAKMKACAEAKRAAKAERPGPPL